MTGKFISCHQDEDAKENYSLLSSFELYMEGHERYTFEVDSPQQASKWVEALHQARKMLRKIPFVEHERTLMRQATAHVDLIRSPSQLGDLPPVKLLARDVPRVSTRAVMLMEGCLEKKQSSNAMSPVRRWQKRFFMLEKGSNHLKYVRNEKQRFQAPVGVLSVVDIQSCHLSNGDLDGKFVVEYPKRTFHLRARSAVEVRDYRYTRTHIVYANTIHDILRYKHTQTHTPTYTQKPAFVGLTMGQGNPLPPPAAP